MLGDLESELIALLKGSELGARLRVVDQLPDVPDKDVLTRWGVDAPAAYVVAMDGSLTDAVATAPFVVVLVARNARGAGASRQGDARTIGLYEMLEEAIAELHGGQTDSASWSVTGYQFLQNEAARDKGLQVALVATQSNCDPPQRGGLNLADFTVFHGDIDIEPNSSTGDHQRWANEDHSAPAPDLQSHINPQEAL